MISSHLSSGRALEALSSPPADRPLHPRGWRASKRAARLQPPVHR